MLSSAKPGKTSLTMVILMAALVFYLVWLAFPRLESRPPVRIGVLHSLTGTMAESEAPLVDALRLAVEEVNASGGIHGVPVEMLVEDCRSDAAFCADRAEKLITVDQVQSLFGCWTSACRKAVKAVVEKHDHLLFYPLQYEGMERSPNIVHTGPAPNQQVVPMVSWAMQRFGKRIYLVGSDYVFPRTVNRIVERQLRAFDAQLLGERYVPLGARDFTVIAREIKALHPAFVLNTLNGDSNRYFFHALREAGVRAAETPVFSTSIAEAELAAIGPELVAGHYAGWSYFQSVDSAANREFVARFKARFGAERVLDDPMESAYVAVHLWANALRDAGDYTQQDLRTQLKQATLAAPVGIVAMEPDNLHLWEPVRIGRARPDGQFDVVWQSGRSVAPAPYPFFVPFDQYAAVAGGAP